jgi:hypothetical protein
MYGPGPWGSNEHKSNERSVVLGGEAIGHARAQLSSAVTFGESGRGSQEEAQGAEALGRREERGRGCGLAKLDVAQGVAPGEGGRRAFQEGVV